MSYISAYLAFLLSISVILGPLWCKPIGSPILPLVLETLVNNGVLGENFLDPSDINNEISNSVLICLIASLVLNIFTFLLDRLFCCNQIFKINQVTTKYRVVGLLFIVIGVLSLAAVINFQIFTLENKNKLEGAYDLFNLYEKISKAGGGVFLKCDYGISYYTGWVVGILQIFSGFSFIFWSFLKVGGVRNQADDGDGDENEAV